MRPPDFWQTPRDPRGYLLAPLGWIYDIAGRLHRRFAAAIQVNVPVFCIGNLTLGGAGKTPVAMDLGARLQARGRDVHFLSRGYGGSLKGPVRVRAGLHDALAVGDEPLLLSRIAPSWVSRDRLPGARAAIEQGAACLILDDGFQNSWIVKDRSILVVDGGAGFGNGRVFPAGPLRETPTGGLARADAVVIVGADTAGCQDALADFAGPVLRAQLTPGGEAENLRGLMVLAFAGIGRPAKFFQTLEDMGCQVVDRRAFGDHYAYTRADLASLVADARRLGAVLVTTEKDAVRVPDVFRDVVKVLSVALEWEDETALEALLDRIGDDG